MVEIIISYWWVGLIGALICGGISLAMHIKQRREVSAQFIEPVSFFGCLLIVFNSIGIVSAIFSIIAGLIKVFLWYVGA